MWIMVAGPYSSGAKNAEERQANLDAMNRAAFLVWQKGHTPIIGVNAALPIIEAVEEASFEDVMMPLSLALTARCDAILRVGGPSKGADQEVETFVERGLPVFRSIEEIPSVERAS